MRIALVSDIHSNLPALSAVKGVIDTLEIDSLVCAGDVVGYGASPNECCRVVAGWTNNASMGNHDLASLTRDTRGMNPYASRAIDWTSEQLDKASKTYLEGRPESVMLQLGGTECSVHHGSLRNIWEYLYEDDVSERMLEEEHVQVLVFGHTHVPYWKKFRAGVIVNPGSVGQPRDGDPRASFALLDTDRLECRIVRAEYDIEAAAESIREAGLPPMLAERLYDGH